MENEKKFLFVQFYRYVSEVQVRIIKIDDFGANTVYKTMNFQNIQKKVGIIFLTIIWDFQNDIKHYSQSKTLDFIKVLRNKIKNGQKGPKNHVFSGGTGKNGPK